MERANSSMRMRWIGCALLLLISAEVIQAYYRDHCQTDLFWKLKEMSEVTQVKKALAAVEDPDNTKIGEVTVTELLKFSDTSCQLEGLTGYHFREPGPIYCERRKETEFRVTVELVHNQGLLQFRSHFLQERKAACVKEMNRFLQKALNDIKTDQMNSRDHTVKILKQFYPWWNEKMERGYIKNLSAWFGHENYFSSCVTLIKTLQKNMPPHECPWLSQYDKSVKEWHNIDHACRDYVKKQCSKLEVMQSKNLKEQCETIKEALNSQPL